MILLFLLLTLVPSSSSSSAPQPQRPPPSALCLSARITVTSFASSSPPALAIPARARNQAQEATSQVTVVPESRPGALLSVRRPRLGEPSAVLRNRGVSLRAVCTYMIPGDPLPVLLIVTILPGSEFLAPTPPAHRITIQISPHFAAPHTGHSHAASILELESYIVNLPGYLATMSEAARG
eukprot:2494959-Rhodomonas_salina.1